MTPPAPPPRSGHPAIPLFDLRLTEDDVAAAAGALRSGRLAAGERTAAFEAAFAEHLGGGEVVALASCTAALHLALLGLGVGPGDEVVVPSFTFVATAAAVRYCGATPVFADVVGPDRPTVDPDHVASLLTARTRAVVCVHFAGYDADVHDLRALCDGRGLALVEDAAHAPDATSRRGAALGTIGDVGCFSLFSNKVLSVGEGGMLRTADPAVATLARNPPAGLHHRFDDVRAALATSRLGGLGADVAARRRLTRRYRERLAGVPGVTVPFADDDVERTSGYVMPVMVDDPARREPVRDALRADGVQTSVLYPAAHRLSAYRDPSVVLPRTDACSDREITLPLFPHLTDDEQDHVVDRLAAALADGVAA